MAKEGCAHQMNWKEIYQFTFFKTFPAQNFCSILVSLGLM